MRVVSDGSGRCIAHAAHRVRRLVAGTRFCFSLTIQSFQCTIKSPAGDVLPVTGRTDQAHQRPKPVDDG
jgi:hypothetical protein